MADKNRGALIGGIVIGAAIGAVAGLLTAPRRGKDARKMLKKTVTAVPQMAEDISSSVKLQGDRFAATVSDNWHDTLDRLATAIAAGIVASQSGREINPPINPDLADRFEDSQ